MNRLGRWVKPLASSSELRRLDLPDGLQPRVVVLGDLGRDGPGQPFRIGHPKFLDGLFVER